MEPNIQIVMTIGHSTRTLDDFVGLLRAHHVAAVADVRRFPQSRRHPHFAGEALAHSLPAHGIVYRHFTELGGRRSGAKAAPPSAWQHSAFAAYARHMLTPEFEAALAALLALADTQQTAIMCAEGPWWRCHRRLIADALVARGVAVRHIMAPSRAPDHQLTPFAHVDGSTVTYPAAT